MTQCLLIDHLGFRRQKPSMESFEHELEDQSKVLEKGVYGLPEAVANIQSLKSKVSVLNQDRAGKSHTSLHRE